MGKKFGKETPLVAAAVTELGADAYLTSPICTDGGPRCTFSSDSL